MLTFMMNPGRRSKFSLTMLSSSSSLSGEVLYETTVMERVLATPMAYDTWTRQRRQTPAFTSDLATQRAPYAADRSTLTQIHINIQYS